jgi:uncharacterized repeat protein (TIGR03803 family)
MGAGGILYGATGGPGKLNTLGAVYSLTPPAFPGGSWTETTLYSFAGPLDGENAYGSLAVGGDGELYGTTSFGGGCVSDFWGCGTVFSLTPPGGLWTETVLHYFDHVDDQRVPADGAHPIAGLTIGTGGTLIGTTSLGGTNGAGTVFLLRPPVSPDGVWGETRIYNFGAAAGDADGVGPGGGVVFGKGGVLYGTTEFGGASGAGTVFSLTPPASRGGAWIETVLYSFVGGGDGQMPAAGVAMGAGGVLYGTTFQGGIRNATCLANLGCGTVFSLTPPASAGGRWTKTTLHGFTGGTDGYGPFGGVFMAEGGTLFGATEFGGSCSISTAGCGTVYALQP